MQSNKPIRSVSVQGERRTGIGRSGELMIELGTRRIVVLVAAFILLFGCDAPEAPRAVSPQQPVKLADLIQTVGAASKLPAPYDDLPLVFEATDHDLLPDETDGSGNSHHEGCAQEALIQLVVQDTGVEFRFWLGGLVMRIDDFSALCEPHGRVCRVPNEHFASFVDGSLLHLLHNPDLWRSHRHFQTSGPIFACETSSERCLNTIHDFLVRTKEHVYEAHLGISKTLFAVRLQGAAFPPAPVDPSYMDYPMPHEKW